jgi:demethylmenaquinone methyltransferase/2-methoxy-6-polyprenyl-1,4-benzoquinol methylase
MFANIANRYDLLNRVMTFGQDGRWRREAVGVGCSENPSMILDLGAGTGDLALEILRQHPNSSVIAVDFTPEMMSQGRGKRNGKKILWVVADVQYLPFASELFDSSLSGFLMRNLRVTDQVLAEQHRVLTPAGRIAILDTTPPTDSFFKPILTFYINYLVPMLGRILAADYAAYSYRSETTKQFLTVSELGMKMSSAGYLNIKAVKRMFGMIAIHSGQKPD